MVDDDGNDDDFGYRRWRRPRRPQRQRRRERASRPATMVKGDASAVHRNLCWGLTGSVWLRTGSLWCENLGNIPLWLPDIP